MDDTDVCILCCKVSTFTESALATEGPSWGLSTAAVLDTAREASSSEKATCIAFPNVRIIATIAAALKSGIRR